jgi:hypothetical protein
MVFEDLKPDKYRAADQESVPAARLKIKLPEQPDGLTAVFPEFPEL